jgi:sugar-phosphatase
MLADATEIAFPGAHALISAAASDPDCKLCIATSSPRDKANATLQAANIPLKSFAGYINGSMVEKKKPDPEIYETAARSIGLLPGQCVAVEDAPAGVEAARAAGMKCVAVLHTFPGRAFKRADLKVPHIQDLTLADVRKLLYI